MDDSEFALNLVDLINIIRTDPERALKIIDDFKQELLTFYPTKKDWMKQLLRIEDSITKGETESLGKVKQNIIVSDIANTILSNLAKIKGNKIYPESDEFLNTSFKFMFADVEKCKNFVSSGETPENVLLDLLVNENAIDIGHHLLLEPSVVYIGVAHANNIKGKPGTVVIVTDSITEREDQNMEESLLDDINSLRAIPKVSLRVLPEKAKENEEIFKSIRPSQNLTVNERLMEAAKDRVEISEGELDPFNEEKLKKFLKQYGDNYLFADEIITTGNYDNSVDLIKKILNNPNDTKKMFQRKYKQIGFAFGPEKTQAYILLTDRFDEPSNQKDIEITNLQRRLIRPKLTEDEELQIEKDFNSFDVLKKGKIKPSVVLLFMDKNDEFKKKNPLYYQVMKNLNTEENNKNGVNLNQFEDEVLKVIGDFDRNLEENWGKVFDNISGGPREIIGKPELAKIVKDLGFKGSNEEIYNLIDKMDGDIDKKKFLEVLKIIEYRFAQFRK